VVCQLSAIKQNFLKIQKDIQEYSPHPEKVRVVGVAKFQPTERVKEAIAAGIRILGVNYAQEGEQLREFLRDVPILWHFIGHIQSRKAKNLVHYDCIETLDRSEVARKLNEHALKSSRVLKVLIEVNLGDEPQKSGVNKNSLNSLVSELRNLPQLELVGLMAMPPAVEPAARRPFFRELKVLFDSVSSNYPLQELSMGTSDDYQIALQEGATLIRLGTCLFGPRPSRTP